MYIWRVIGDYLSNRIALPLAFIDEIDWSERYAQLDHAEIDVAVICAAPYVRRRDTMNIPVELLAAPVWRTDRYQQRPVYFSDVVVAATSTFYNFADLRGSVAAINEPGSLSGYHSLRYHLASKGEGGSYFAGVVQSGAHLRSLRMIVDRQLDCAAIDSTVLEQALIDQPELHTQIRIVDVIGPNPHPPIVASATLDRAMQQQIRQALITMHEDPAGAAILERLPIARLAAVVDSDYDPVRRLLSRAESVIFE